MLNLKQAVLNLVVMWGISLSLLATGVQAQSGRLEPPGSAVNGSDEPTATTQTQPSWDQDLPFNERFKLVLGGEAVLDKETGRVWERAPVITGGPEDDGRYPWQAALFECTSRTVGGKKGWRLPSVHELASLVDPENPDGNPDLPVGHLFSRNFPSSTLWSATTYSEISTFAWSVFFGNGHVDADGKNSTSFVLCVRGGMNADAY